MELSIDKITFLFSNNVRLFFVKIHGDSQIVMEWVELKQDSVFAGKTIGQSEIRKRTGVSIVGILRKENVVASPDVNEMLFSGDTLMAIGTSEQINRFEEMCLGKGD